MFFYGTQYSTPRNTAKISKTVVPLIDTKIKKAKSENGKYLKLSDSSGHYLLIDKTKINFGASIIRTLIQKRETQLLLNLIQKFHLLMHVLDEMTLDHFWHKI